MGYRTIMWGFLFVLLNFRIQGVDILPDVVGYILMAVGMSQLEGRSPHFKKGVPWAVVMAVLSLGDIYQNPHTAHQPGFHINTFIAGPFSGAFGVTVGVLYTLVTWGLDLLVVYHICMGTAEDAASPRQGLLVEVAERRWSQYLTFKVIVLVCMALPFLLPVAPLVLLIIVGILVYDVVMLVIMMSFMHQSGETLG